MKSAKHGNCYTVAGNKVVQNKDWLLCHGIVDGRGPLLGQKIGHAWNEYQDVVFDFSNGHKVVVRKERYYDIGNIKKVIRYTREEAMKLLASKKHFGPWDKKVQSKWQARNSLPGRVRNEPSRPEQAVTTGGM